MVDAAAVLDRPAWVCRPPDYEVRYDELLRSGAPALAALLATMRVMRAGEALLLRIGFEPTSLYPVLKGRGFIVQSRRRSYEKDKEGASAQSGSRRGAPPRPCGPQPIALRLRMRRVRSGHLRLPASISYQDLGP